MTRVPADAVGTIELYRSGVRNPDGLRAYRVLVDGEERGRIGRNERLTIQAPAGAHVVQLWIDWGHSNSLPLTLANGNVIGLTCHPGPASLWRRSWGILRRQDYCRLELTD